MWWEDPEAATTFALASRVSLLGRQHGEVEALLERAERSALDGNFVKAIRDLLKAAAVAEEMRDEWIDSGLRWNDTHPIAEFTRHASDLVAATGVLIGELAETYSR